MENSSPIAGFKGMMTDIFDFLKMTLSTKKGLAVLSVCTFIYFITLFVSGCVKNWALILAILAILAFFVLSWLIWFRADNPMEKNV
jgi:hypothetical protein